MPHYKPVLDALAFGVPKSTFQIASRNTWSNLCTFQTTLFYSCRLTVYGQIAPTAALD